MALGTIGSALAGGIGRAAVGLGASKLFGSREKGGTSSFAPSGFRGGGLSGGFDPSSGAFSVRPNEQRQGFVGNLAGLFPQQANLVAGLRGQVTPVFGS